MAKPSPDTKFPVEPLRRHKQVASVRFPNIFLCLLCLISVSSAPAQSVPNADLLRMKGVFLKHMNDDKRAIAGDEDLLSRAQAAHQQALSDNDQDGTAVTAQAVDNAQQALDQAKRNLADDQTRLKAVNQALLVWPNDGPRNGPRALATIVRGQITVDTPQGPEPFVPHYPVRPGQHIRVGPNSFLELQLGDGGEMHIGPNSDFEYERDVQGVQWEIFRGELHRITIIMAVRGANDKARYRGPTAICSVRGTDFTLATDGNNDTVTVLEGKVEVDPGKGRDKVSLTGGERLVVPKTSPLPPVSTIDPTKLQRWWDK